MGYNMTVTESDHLAARSELIRMLAEQIVSNALAEGRIVTSTEYANHNPRHRHLRTVFNGSSACDIG